MKGFIIKLFVLALCLYPVNVFSQDLKEEEKSSWFKDNVSIRKTFDGSKNEKKPASFSLFENHKSSNDFFNIDIAIKITEWEFLENTNTILTLFPVVEWHKSSNEEDEKDKLSLGLNGEFYFGKDLKLKPYLLSNFAFKRNLIKNVNELKYVAQISFIGNTTNLPGVAWRFDNDVSDYKGMYYPYFGYEYNEIPDLITQGKTEAFSTLFFRLFLDYWLHPRAIQFIFNGTYRTILGNNDNLKNNLPLLSLSLNYYPGRQENISIGFDYKNGYDPDSKFQQIEVTSLNLKVKF
jgi:hypothetical protein